MAVAGLVAAGCVAAGIWQWHRHEQRSVAVERVLTNYDAAPVEITRLLADGPAGASPTLPDEAVWHPATVHGRYLTGDTGSRGPVLLRNRPVGGVPGFHVLAPFEVTEGGLAGAVLVVDRGWVHTGGDSSQPASTPPVPTGPVDLVVRLRPDEPASTRDAPAGQVHSIAVDQVRTAAGGAWPAEATLPLYGQAVSENGAAPPGLGPLARPGTDLGSHLSYTFQWWVFALGALAGGVLLAVREDRTAAGDRVTPSGGNGQEPGRRYGGAPGSDPGTKSARRPARRRRPTAEEEEDALIDAQLR